MNEEELRAILHKLPKNVADAIFSDTTVSMVRSIGSAHRLHIDLIGTFEGITLDVLLGITPIGDMKKRLINEIRVPEEEADQILTEVNEKIFIPIRDNLHHTLVEQAKKEDIVGDVAIGETAPIPHDIAPPHPLPETEVTTKDAPPTSLTTSQPGPKEDALTTSKPETPDTGLIAEKLQSVVGSSTTGAEVKKEPPGYVADPYREPIE